jgi:YYY domain-containing protein
MLPILTFWLIIQCFTVAALPLAWRLFAALPSRGYALTKPLGLLLVTYVLWLAGSLGFLRHSAGGVLLSWVIVAAASLWLGRAGWQRDAAGRRPWLDWLAANKRLIFVTELLFFVALAGWAAVRSYSPEITTAGGEKFMELTFLNGILRSEQFPPLDPWLSGFAISYYYFGYVMLAALTRLSGLAPSVAFNVGLATWFALTLTAAFGVAFDMAAALLARAAERSSSQSTNLPPDQSTNLPNHQSANSPIYQSTRAGSPSAYVAGLLGALFVGVVSNLAGFLESLHNLGLGSLAFWRWLDIKDLNCLSEPAYIQPIANCPTPGSIAPDRFFWWWRASRVINDRDLMGNAVEVIDEFPFFSFLLGDMHPHVLALPFVLLAIGLALALVLRGAEGKEKNEEKEGTEDSVASSDQPITDHRSPITVKRSPLPGLLAAFPMGAVGFALYALCLGGLAFLNTWDFPIYVFLVMLALGVSMVWRQGRPSWSVAGKALLAAIALGVAGILLYLPFYIGFQSQAGGILPNFVFPTRLAQFFVMFGPLLAAAIFLLLALSTDRRSTLRGWLRFVPLTVLAPIAFLLVMLIIGVATPGGQEFISRLRDLPVVREQVGDASLAQIAAQVVKLRIGSPWTYLLLAGLLAWVLALLALWARPQNFQTTNPPIYTNPVISFALLALLTALLLAFSVEFVYLRDTFGVRMNTVFKFYYQAWVLLALVAAFAVIYLAHCAGRVLRWLGLTVIALLVVAGLFYPVFATYSRAEQFAREPTLDGAAYLARDYPGDAAAIAWLRANVPGAATVLEAPGGSYSYFGRISAQTGLPTLLGWEGHELQWRGDTVEQDKRRPDIERIYRNAQGAELQRLLDTWQVDYVVVGDLERQTYGISPPSEARFARAMDLVYDSDNVRIYRRRG